MSTSIPSSWPSGAIRASFETAARSYNAARAGGAELPVVPRPVSAGGVEAAIARAAEATTVDFGYLLAQAEVESSLNPQARARTSSATGLYQFIESTWLQTMKKHGPRFGLGHISDQIDLTASGRAAVGDPQQRAAILALRSDPQVASLMAAGLAEDNRAHLVPVLGRQPNHAELYLAHFLGAGGAAQFLTAMQENPEQSAAALFAAPAAANRRIFFSSNGKARSLAGVMEVLSEKLVRAGANTASSPSPYIAPAADILAASHPGWSAPSAPTTAMTPIAADRSAGFSARPLQTSAAAPRVPMSKVLGAAFGIDSSAAPAQVRRAYEQLKGLGL